tara:strand:+ start:120 stop:284 length:165 start_codon:yes stop_codon:yes gene_type:complete
MKKMKKVYKTIDDIFNDKDFYKISNGSYATAPEEKKKIALDKIFANDPLGLLDD